MKKASRSLSVRSMNLSYAVQQRVQHAVLLFDLAQDLYFGEPLLKISVIGSKPNQVNRWRSDIFANLEVASLVCFGLYQTEIVIVIDNIFL